MARRGRSTRRYAGIPRHEYKRLRLEIAHEQFGLCVYCGTVLTYDYSPNGIIHGTTATMEHIRCRSKNGANVKKNFAVSCYDCNNERSDMDHFEFLTIKQAQIRSLSPCLLLNLFSKI